MAAPLSALSPSGQNTAQPPPSTANRQRSWDFESYEEQSTSTFKQTTSAPYQIYEDPEESNNPNNDVEDTFQDTSDHVPSSPFVADVTGLAVRHEHHDKENWDSPSRTPDAKKLDLRGGGVGCEACPSPHSRNNKPSKLSGTPSKSCNASPANSPTKSLKSPRSQSPLKHMVMGLTQSPKLGHVGFGFGLGSPRSPVKTMEQTQPEPRETTLKFNEDLTTALDTAKEQLDSAVDLTIDVNVNVEDESVIHHNVDVGDMTIDTEVGDEGMSTIYNAPPEEDTQRQDAFDGAGEESVTMDDTCLSTFSAVPNMTLFAGLRGESPTKTFNNTNTTRWSPSKQLQTGKPGLLRRGQTMPTRLEHEDQDATPRRPRDDTMDLLNFTGQSNVFAPPPSGNRRVSSRGGFPIRISPTKSHASLERERLRDANGTARSPSPKRTTFNPGTTFEHVAATPTARRNLLDLDIEPLPTPRSIPTITPRELESMRSDFNSQISSLKATLSGKEAEVSALKTAIEDAEGRVGTALEEVRSERGMRESLEHERGDWEKRGREMESILRDVKQEIMVAEREREKFSQKADELEKKSEDSQVRVLELQTQLDSANKRAVAMPINANGTGDVEKAVADAVNATARELHELYKNKHVEKVAALKKSYEKRWERKVKTAEDQLREAQEELEAIKTARDATMSGVIPSELRAREEEGRREKMELEAERKKLEARIQGLEQEMKIVEMGGEELRNELERERVEKGELVQAAEAWLAVQDEEHERQAMLQQTPVKPEAAAFSRPSAAVQSGLDNLRGSVSRASGLKMPSKIGGGESRIGRVPTRMPQPGSANQGGRTPSGSRINGGAGVRSHGIMRDIERMGMKG